MPVTSSEVGSSSTAAEKDVASLRDRLRSEDPSQSRHAKSQSPKAGSNGIYRQLRTGLSVVVDGPARNSKALDQLSDAFARTGDDIHALSLQSIQSAHDHTSAEISAFQAQAAATKANVQSLYDNITHRLSATLCHSNVSASASVGRHMHILREKIAIAKMDLEELNTKWDACLAEEAAIMKEMCDASEEEAKHTLEALSSQVEGIVQKQAGQLDELDMEYRDLLWAESKRMMKAMMAD